MKRGKRRLMSFYSRYLLPRLINYAMTYEEVTRLRRARVPDASGDVLEVGIGSGLNLPFYSGAVTKLYGVDPSAELLAMAKVNAAGAGFPVELLQQKANGLPLDDDSIDTAVVTWSLCSIDDPAAVLSEMRRVLRPGGAFIFIEHGLSPDIGVRRWQNRLTPVWRRLAGGCHLNRKVDDLLVAAGFDITQMNTGYMPGPKVTTYIYEGQATKS
jgi:ubiquinone/menaquinone biosynthesis C-methylase UbiE